MREMTSSSPGCCSPQGFARLQAAFQRKSGAAGQAGYLQMCKQKVHEVPSQRSTPSQAPSKWKRSADEIKEPNISRPHPQGQIRSRCTRQLISSREAWFMAGWRIRCLDEQGSCCVPWRQQCPPVPARAQQQLDREPEDVIVYTLIHYNGAEDRTATYPPCPESWP